MTFAFFFESTGGGEWLLLLAVILVVVGPKNLPSMLRKIGKITATLRRAADEFRRQVMAMDEEVRSVVNEAAKEMDIEEDSSSSNDSSSSEESSSESGDNEGDMDRAEDYGAYDEDSPYPGYEDSYDYGEDDYDNSDSGPEMEEHQEEPAQETPVSKPIDPENAAIKIVVSKAPGADKV
jgi:sec-independent protein translocase protein TatB